MGLNKYDSIMGTSTEKSCRVEAKGECSSLFTCFCDTLHSHTSRSYREAQRSRYNDYVDNILVTTCYVTDQPKLSGIEQFIITCGLIGLGQVVLIGISQQGLPLGSPNIILIRVWLRMVSSQSSVRLDVQGDVHTGEQLMLTVGYCLEYLQASPLPGWSFLLHGGWVPSGLS